MLVYGNDATTCQLKEETVDMDSNSLWNFKVLTFYDDILL